MNGEMEVCVCGCDVASHFLDRERPGEHPDGQPPKEFRGACLGLRCEGCKRFKRKKPT